MNLRTEEHKAAVCLSSVSPAAVLQLSVLCVSLSCTQEIILPLCSAAPQIYYSSPSPLSQQDGTRRKEERRETGRCVSHAASIFQAVVASTPNLRKLSEQNPSVIAGVHVASQHEENLQSVLTVSDSLLRPLVMKVKPCVSMATPVFWMCSSAYLQRRQGTMRTQRCLGVHEDRESSPRTQALPRAQHQTVQVCSHVAVPSLKLKFIYLIE